MPADVRLRAEAREDHAEVRRVNEAAFGGAEEADLVDALRDAAVVLSSIVAEADGTIVGHVLFSRMAIESADGSLPAVALAPIAVLPQWQRQGIGGALIRDGLARLSRAGEGVVIVVGHPQYYPRFGFARELVAAIEHPFPPDAFMGLELKPGALAAARGRVRYPPPFGI